MPPLITQPVPVAASAPAVQHHNVPPAAGYTAWNNPVPSQFRQLDRNHALQSVNGKFLEMHPNGTRGVSEITKYCYLIIYINNITAFANSSSSRTDGGGGQTMKFDWMKEHKGQDPKGHAHTKMTHTTHVIRSNVTGQYLCMNNESIIYQQDEYDSEHCLFQYNYDGESYQEQYYRKVKKPNKTHKSQWFLGINKDGSIRCGNVTRVNQKGANFYRVDIDDKVQNPNSPPFKAQRIKCCANKKCKRRQRNKEKSRDSPKRKKRCYKNWCRRHRRKFFQLKLKNVKRYYNRCINNKEQIRHCKNR